MAILINYDFDLGTEKGRADFEALGKRLKAQGFKRWEHHPTNGPKSSFEGGPVDLELKFLFENQWNSTEHRLFDWVENQKQNFLGASGSGYYLNLNPKEKAARANTVKCGYCQAHYGTHHETHLPVPSSGLCIACQGSEYLKLDDVKKGAIRLYPVATFMADGWIPLTQLEFEDYLPNYDAAQERSKLARIEKARKAEREKMEEKYLSAKGEYQGKLWLWDKGYETANVIYYSHTAQFCFGWRTPLTADEEMHLLDEVLVGAPFEFELKVQG